MYDSMINKKRNKEMFSVFLDSPNLTYREIGAMFGISRQRAHQIITREIKATGDYGCLEWRRTNAR